MFLSYREREKLDDEDMGNEFNTTPSEKAVQDTIVIERDGAVQKRRWQTAHGRRYLVCAEFETPCEGQSVRRKLEQVIDLSCERENVSA